MKTGVTFIALSVVFALAAWRVSAQSAPQALSPETVRLIDSVEGPALYKAYCAVCHGNDGLGNGPMAAILKTAPSDLTRIATRNGGMYPAARVSKVISGEGDIAGHGARAMPVWGPIFSQIAWDQDLGQIRIRNLTDYIGKMQKR
jgi:mono/diheme cytochrome c family protein